MSSKPLPSLEGSSLNLLQLPKSEFTIVEDIWNHNRNGPASCELSNYSLSPILRSAYKSNGIWKSLCTCFNILQEFTFYTLNAEGPVKLSHIKDNDNLNSNIINNTNLGWSFEKRNFFALKYLGSKIASKKYRKRR